jgi:hypothetical protein
LRFPELTGFSRKRVRGWLPREPVAARHQRSTDPRLGISTLAVAVIIFVVIGIGVELAFLPRASSGGSTETISTSTGTYSCTGCSPPPLKNAVDQWVGDFNTRDVTALGNFYAPDGAVVWSGVSQAGSLLGTYNGNGNIRILYGSSIGRTTALVANVSNYNEKDINPSNSNVSLTLTMNGNSTVVGILAITVDVNQQWNYIGGQWQIVKESWNYVKFYESIPVSSTTFPQWSAMKLGQNPNLVSEKSFEWHAGPYVAASVYAFLVGMLAFSVMKFRNRPKRI